MDLSDLGKIDLHVTVYEASLIKEGLKRLINRTYIEHPQLGAEHNKNIRSKINDMQELINRIERLMNL
jgi:hypothetical protein